MSRLVMHGTYRLHRGPALCCCLIAIGIIARIVQDGDAHTSIRVHCRTSKAGHHSRHSGLYERVSKAGRTLEVLTTLQPLQHVTLSCMRTQCKPYTYTV
jgi:hypothetical protein